MSETPGQPQAPGQSEDGRVALPTWNRSRSKRTSEAGGESAEIVDAIAGDDAFQRGVRQAGQAAARRVPMVIGAVVLLAGVGAGIVAWQQHLAGERAKGTRAVAEAAALASRGAIDDASLAERKNPPPFPIYKDEADRQAKIEAQLQALRSVGGQPMALFDHLLTASQAMRNREWAQAIASYDAFIAQAPADHALRSLALEGRIIAKENNGDATGALADAQALAADGNKEPGRTLGQWHEARLLALQGDAANATAKLKALIERGPSEKAALPFVETAKYLLARLEAGETIELKPLPPPVPAQVQPNAPSVPDGGDKQADSTSSITGTGITGSGSSGG